MVRPLARAGLAAVCAFIVYESLGDLRSDGPGIWEPLLISYHDIAENVAVYVVFGALAVLSLKSGAHQPWPGRTLAICAAAVLFSVGNETLQLYTVDRVASVTDIASAAFGAFTGAAAITAWGGAR